MLKMNYTKRDARPSHLRIKDATGCRPLRVGGRVPVQAGSAAGRPDVNDRARFQRQKLDLDRQAAVGQDEEVRGPVNVVDHDVITKDRSLGNREENLVDSRPREIVSVAGPVFDQLHACRQLKPGSTARLHRCGHVLALSSSCLAGRAPLMRGRGPARFHNSVLLIYIDVMQ